jgi:carbonic anhydrase/acetyltransferase-like protein (isoleucine patch superfamily)
MPIIRAFKGIEPKIAKSAFIAEDAVITGDVEIAEDASIWYGCVLRGDVGPIRIGARSNIQDLSMIHTTGGLSSSIIGQDVTVGHRVVIHGARVQDGALIGMGAILLDNCNIGEEALVAAGAVVPIEMEVPARHLARGIPAKVVRELEKVQYEQGRKTARKYLDLASHYRG